MGVVFFNWKAVTAASERRQQRIFEKYLKHSEIDPTSPVKLIQSLRDSTIHTNEGQHNLPNLLTQIKFNTSQSQHDPMERVSRSIRFSSAQSINGIQSERNATLHSQSQREPRSTQVLVKPMQSPNASPISKTHTVTFATNRGKEKQREILRAIQEDLQKRAATTKMLLGTSAKETV